MFRKQNTKISLFLIVALVLVASTVVVAAAFTPLPVKDDPLVRMPGTQPNQVTLESPGRCLNCHAGYDSAVEPGFNWQGSMMSQAARDFLYLSAVTVAAQDSITALGNPNATDLCLRCHFPEGWLEGRSDPTNASLMTGSDWDGVQCDFCHSMVDPFFAENHADLGEAEDLDPTMYWDETNTSSTPSQPAADEAFALDTQIAGTILQFNNKPFYIEKPIDENGPLGLLPRSEDYDESTGGQYFMSDDGAKRASFADAAARHQMVYSRFHKSRAMCATCHDVSNAALANADYLAIDTNDPKGPLPSETQAANSYYHIERTFSEFMLSDYAEGYGAAGIGPFAPDLYETSNRDNVINKCQDCHMRDVIGTGANKKGTPVRPGESVEHPESGQPLHDLTGGNVWVAAVLASAVADSPNYNSVNAAELNQGPATLTLDLSQGEGINPEALLAGVERAKQQLELAATVDITGYSGGVLTFTIQNQTGHKLISGFPEGRRMFINVKGYDTGGSLVYEANPYDYDAGTLKGLGYTYNGQGDLNAPAALVGHEVHVDELVYEVLLSAGGVKTQHVVFADNRYKDNRIPPLGFDKYEAEERLAQPRWDGATNLGYFNDAEYAGGYDAYELPGIPVNAVSFEVSLYYQTTSREFIEFLRDEINLPDTDIQTDSFFDGLRAWGDTIWDLWVNTMDWPGAAPYLMAQDNYGVAPPPPPESCDQVNAPTMVTAVAGNALVDLSWSAATLPLDVPSLSYNVYYDQAGKAQFVADAGAATTYTNTGLTNGQEYCYKVTAYYTKVIDPDTTLTCESDYSSNIPPCATPQNQGQTGDAAGVTFDEIETGYYTGKGKNVSWYPSPIDRGETVVVRTRVTDESGGIANATVEITIGGPETAVLNSNPSDADGWAETTWQTQSPNKKGNGGTPLGTYTASVTNVTASGYNWDGYTASATFKLQ